jgi:hypothetical protein
MHEKTEENSCVYCDEGARVPYDVFSSSSFLSSTREGIFAAGLMWKSSAISGQVVR